jgi:TP901 family phage tail tape measure protein
MATQYVIPTVFQAIDRMSPAMAVITKSMDNFGHHADVAISRGERAFRRMMTPMRTMGRTFNSLMGGLGAPVGIAAFGLAVKSAGDVFIDFEAANSNVAAGLDMTAKQIKPLTDDAKRLGAITKFTASQVSELQFEYAKLGFAPDQILKMTESTLSLAAATKFDLGPAATTVGAAIRAFGLQASDAARVSDVLAAAASKTALDMGDFFENMATFAPVAKAFNIPMEDAVALFGKIRDSGFDASSAATALRNIFLNLADSNGLLARALGKPVHTLDAMIKGMVTLRGKGVDLNQMLQLTDKRSVAAFATLLDNAGAVKTLAGELKNAEGFAKKMADTQLNNVAGSLTILKSAWQGWILSIEDGTGSISKGIRTMASVGIDLLQIFSGTAKSVHELTGEEKRIRDMADTVMFWGKAALYTAGAMAAWKAILIGGRVAMTAVNLAIGIGNALFTTSTVLTYQNIVAQKAYLMTSKIVGGALEILNGNFAVLNGTMLANPAFLVVAALTALAGGMYLVSRAVERANEEYQLEIHDRAAVTMRSEASAVKELTSYYWGLGMSMKEATAAAVKFKVMDLAMQRSESESKIAQLQQSLSAEKNKLYLADFFSDFTGGGSPEVGERANIANQLLAEQRTAKALADKNLYITQFAKQQMGFGNLDQASLGTTFNRPAMKQPEPSYWGRAMQQTEAARSFRVADNPGMRVKNEMTVTVKNDSNSAIQVKNNNSKTFDVQPKTRSTTELDER